ncbi:MAG: methyltransferase domain-containing protein [Trebonia sp.]
MWDAQQYLRFGGERARPFFDLIARIGPAEPGYVADLGCGPGNLTQVLAQRWPDAEVIGVDNSAEMIAATSSAVEDGRPRFVLADIRDWRPARPPDVLVCNAVLQWVPDHDDLLLRWADLLAPGGWLAFQLPGNFDQPSQVIVRELAGSPRWRPLLAGVKLNRQAGDPEEYAELLARPGYEVDAWATSYVHILENPGDGAAHPVVEWVKGSALRPVLAALDAEQGEAFLTEYGERVRLAYEPRTFGTLFSFRRVFTVLHRRADPSPS